MQGRKAAGAPALGRVLPTPPGAQCAPLPPLVRAPPVTAGSTARKALNGPLEFVPRGAEPPGGRSPTSVYDTPQDQSLQIRQLLKENQNLKLKVYFMEEKLRGQVMRLGAPGGFESVLQESLEAQVSLKAAQEELGVRDELLARARDTVDSLQRDLSAAQATAAAASSTRADAEASAAMTREQLGEMLADLRARQEESGDMQAALCAAELARRAAEQALVEAQAALAERDVQAAARAAAASTSRQLADAVVDAALAKEAVAASESRTLKAELAAARSGATPAPRTLSRHALSALKSAPRTRLPPPPPQQQQQQPSPVDAAFAVRSNMEFAAGAASPAAAPQSGEPSEYQAFLEQRVAELEEEIMQALAAAEEAAEDAGRARAALSPLQAAVAQRSNAQLDAALARAHHAEAVAQEATAANDGARRVIAVLETSLESKQSELAALTTELLAMAKRMRAISGGASPTLAASPHGAMRHSALDAALAGLERELGAARAAAAAAVQRADARAQEAVSARLEVDALAEEAEALAAELAEAQSGLAAERQARLAAEHSRAGSATDASAAAERCAFAEAAAAQAAAEASRAVAELRRAKEAALSRRDAQRAQQAQHAACGPDADTLQRLRSETRRLRAQLEALNAELEAERGALSHVQTALLSAADAPAAIDALRAGMAGTPMRVIRVNAEKEEEDEDAGVPATPVPDASSRATLSAEALDALEAMLAATPVGGAPENAAPATPGLGKHVLAGLAQTRRTLEAVSNQLGRISGGGSAEDARGIGM